jgi:hypothetical protein
MALTSLPGKAAVTVRSNSGQFVVHSSRATRLTLAPSGSASGGTLVSLDPDPLAVSCERIKAALLQELGSRDQWRGKIHVWLQAQAPATGPLTVGATRYSDGWQYDIHLPEQVEGMAVVRVVIQALLTETAGRYAGSYSPEIPIWLVEGLTGKLASRVGPDLVVQANPLLGAVGNFWGQVKSSSREQHGTNLDPWRAWLAGHRPLDFKELSLPAADWLTGENLVTYSVCAQLFLDGLQQLPGGRQALWSMLTRLTQHLNWQTAFLRAYQDHFPRFLDVEKWWALMLARLASQGTGQPWSQVAVLARLAEVLQVPVEVRRNPHELPQRTAVPLIEALGWSDDKLVTEVLQARIGLLESLRPSAPEQLALLVDGYKDVLQACLVYRTGPRRGQRQGQAPLESRLQASALFRRFQELDQRRNALEAQASTPAPDANLGEAEKKR